MILGLSIPILGSADEAMDSRVAMEESSSFYMSLDEMLNDNTLYNPNYSKTQLERIMIENSRAGLTTADAAFNAVALSSVSQGGEPPATEVIPAVQICPPGGGPPPETPEP